MALLLPEAHALVQSRFSRVSVRAPGLRSTAPQEAVTQPRSLFKSREIQAQPRLRPDHAWHV